MTSPLSQDKRGKVSRTLLAVILGGSLSHDKVWAKSDIDLVLVTVDDRKVETDSLCLDADGVNVHAMLMPRTEFRRTVEGWMWVLTGAEN